MAEHAPILPQQATPADAVITSVEWVFEPYWSGDRLIARLHDGRVSLTDAAGQPAGDEFADAASLLTTAIDAEQAVIDAIWTAQHLDADPPPPDARPAATPAEMPRILVAIDLVELDGQSLTGIPFLERRRLLASVLEESRRVRISPAIRHPADRWMLAWRSQGFTRCVAKHVNSRYRLGQRAEDWLIVSNAPDRRPSLLAGMFGRRPAKVRRIED